MRTIKDRDKLTESIRTMLVSEVAGPAPERGNIPPAEKERRISCLIGEEMRERVWSKTSGTLPPRESSTSSGYTAWQQAEYLAHTKKCLAGQTEPIRNWVELLVTIGPDGMVIGDPETKDPVDNDGFRQDVKTALKKLHQRQPFIVDPIKGNKTWFKQVFRFSPEKSHQEPTIAATIDAHFRKCWTASRTGPTIRLMLGYKLDGTYSSRPLLINPENTAAYSRAADEVIRQITKCPPLKFQKDKYEQVRNIRWQFPSHESASASRPKRM